MGQLWPAACFCAAPEIRMVCIFLDGWEEVKKYSVTHEKHVKLKFQFLEIKFYQCRAPLLCVLSVSTFIQQ